MSTSWQWAKANPDAAARRIRDLERENAALRNKLASLKHETQWECICGGTDCEGQKENAALREDKQILDWMNGNTEAIMFKYKPDNFTWDVREIMRGAMRNGRLPQGSYRLKPCR